jgi:hypothetical protein
MTASKIKHRLEQYGAKYGRFYIEKKRMRGYIGLKLNSENSNECMFD